MRSGDFRRNHQAQTNRRTALWLIPAKYACGLMEAGPRVGTDFAGYRIHAIIGRGGMGTVYRAENPRLGSMVAIKVLAAQFSSNEAFRERFVRESRLAASLNHPNVIPIYDAGHEHDELYIVMRYVAGADLRRLLSQHGQLPLDAAARILVQACDGVDAAHARDLVHRDVKPANILLEPAGGDPLSMHVYVADFGLAKDVARDERTSSSGVTGTFDYMSPEQIEGRPVDRRADVYSLGCMLYECLCGAAPFARDADTAVLWAHLQEEPTPATVIRTDLPSGVDTVIGSAMSKSVEGRYQSCGDLARDLRSIAAIDRPIAAGARRRPLAGARRRRLSGLWVGIAISVAAVAGAALALGLGALTTGDGGSTPAGSTGSHLSKLQMILQNGIGLQGCTAPEDLPAVPAERISCISVAPSVSTLTVTLFSGKGDVSVWNRLADRYRRDVRFFARRDPSLKPRLNTGPCGSQPADWHREDAWRRFGKQSIVKFSYFWMIQQHEADGRVLCWTSSRTGSLEIEWTLNDGGAYLLAKADGSNSHDHGLMFHWWERVRSKLVAVQPRPA